MKIYDITRKMKNGMPVWPGDTPFEFNVSSFQAESGIVNVGTVTMSTHTGTHVDAPFHFDSNGKRILELDLELYVGPVKVLDMAGKDQIGPKDFAGIQLEGFERVLLRTFAWKNPALFPEKIPYLLPEVGPYLAAKGIRLIGVDLPSVDPLDSEELSAHHSLNQNGIHILESVVLDEVEIGEYELIALPLALAEADGSPVRAILRTLL